MSSNAVRECPLPKRRFHHQTLESAIADQGADAQRKNQVLPARRLPKLTTVAGTTAGVVAMAVPLVGFASPWSASATEEKIVGTFDSGDSWVASETDTPAIAETADLEQVHSATSRAKVRTPVQVSTCVVGTQPASGDREITQKQVTLWPLQEGTFTETSSFSWRVSPISGETLMHEGVDWAAAGGTPIHSVAEGVVTEVGSDSRSGGFVVITHQDANGGTYTSAYLHQYPEDIRVTQGQTVKAGEVIGAVGSAGWSTGDHLHFEIRDAGNNPVDPVNWLVGQSAMFFGEAC